MKRRLSLPRQKWEIGAKRISNVSFEMWLPAIRSPRENAERAEFYALYSSARARGGIGRAGRTLHAKYKSSLRAERDGSEESARRGVA